MKKTLTFLSVLLFSVILAGCSLPTQVQPETEDQVNQSTEEVESSASSEVVVEEAAPVTNDTSLDTIEMELKDTTIIDEDFSDL